MESHKKLTSEELMKTLKVKYSVESPFEAVNYAIKHAKEKLEHEPESESNPAIEVVDELQKGGCSDCSSCHLC